MNLLRILAPPKSMPTNADVEAPISWLIGNWCGMSCRPEICLRELGYYIYGSEFGGGYTAKNCSWNRLKYLFFRKTNRQPLASAPNRQCDYVQEVAVGRTRGADAGKERHSQGVVWPGGGKAAAGQTQDEVGRQRSSRRHITGGQRLAGLGKTSVEGLSGGGSRAPGPVVPEE